jgi:hypothetical protein
MRFYRFWPVWMVLGFLLGAGMTKVHWVSRHEVTREDAKPRPVKASRLTQLA